MSSYRRWVKHEEDVDRLPHGMVRTAYDADMRQYTFLDTTSQTHYVSAPGEAYGTLVPAATANFPKSSRSAGRKPTLQAYDRPVFFADDTMHQRHSSSSKGNKSAPSTPVHRSSTTVRKHGHGGGGHKRSASFSDLLPPHLITSASKSQNSPPPPPKPTSYARGRGAPPVPHLEKKAPLPRSSRPRPRSQSPPPPPYEDEKKSPWWSASADALLPSLPPVPPPKDISPVSPGGGGNGGVCAPRLALRVLGRTLDAVKGGHRSRGEQPTDDGWVVV